MPRKDYFYVPLPIEMAVALDEMITKEGKRYGIGERTELIRLVLGEFIEKYEKTGKSLMDTRRRMVSEEWYKIYNKTKPTNNNNNHKNSKS